MCTVVALIRPEQPWPVILATLRDERLDRAWDPPAAHWPDRPGVVAGRDRTAGGSWLGVNRAGLVASVLNRPGSLGPDPAKRSRGLLVLDALAETSAAVASTRLAASDGRAWRPFNLVLADRLDAIWLTSDGSGPIRPEPLPPGISMLTAHGRNHQASPRVRVHLPRFEAARVPDPGAGDWTGWLPLLRGRDFAPADGPAGAMTIPPTDGYGTVCASLLAIAADPGRRPLWLFAAGPPDTADFSPVALD